MRRGKDLALIGDTVGTVRAIPSMVVRVGFEEQIVTGQTHYYILITQLQSSSHRKLCVLF